VDTVVPTATSYVQDVPGADLEEIRDDIAHECDDHGPEEVGDQRVAKRSPPDRLLGEIGVRDLEGHADREGEVGEISVVGPFRVVEVDPTWFVGVVKGATPVISRLVTLYDRMRDFPQASRKARRWFGHSVHPSTRHQP
jgi:hypothetical protein